MKLMQEKRNGILQYTWSWYDDDGEEISPVFSNQDEAVEWMERQKVRTNEAPLCAQ